MKVELLSFKSSSKEGALLGTLSFRNHDKKITVHNCKLFKAKAGHKFLSMPDKEYEKDGQKKYFPLIQFDDKEETKEQERLILQQLETFKPKESCQELQCGDVPF